MAVSEDIYLDSKFLKLENKSLKGLDQSFGGLSPKIPPIINAS